MAEPTCDYNYYNTKGTDANYHRLPLYTPDLQLCQKYFDNTITEKDYSKLKNANGYLCNPWCDIDTNKCSSNKISINNNKWIVNGKATDYANHIVRTMAKGEYDDPKNECALLKDGEKTCNTIDNVCCGKGFAGAKGEFCDRLDKNRLYISACYDGQPNQCCGHGTCTDGICKCDKGYTGNCCDCADGYSKNSQGECVENTVNCCNFTTGDLVQIPKEQCTGDLKIVNDPQKCFPFNKFVCTDKTCEKEAYTEEKKGIKSIGKDLMDSQHILYISMFVFTLLYFTLVILMKK